MCSYVHIECSRKRRYIPSCPLVGPIRIRVWVPGGVDAASNRSTSMQQVRKLVSKKELKSVYGIPYCFAHIARLEKEEPPAFPKRIQLGACRVAWFADEVEAWIAERPRAS